MNNIPFEYEKPFFWYWNALLTQNVSCRYRKNVLIIDMDKQTFIHAPLIDLSGIRV